jgi:hypothetical protein
MPEAATLDRMIAVRGQFLRSIHLERDYRAESDNGYHLTESAYNALSSQLTWILKSAGGVLRLNRLLRECKIQLN